MVVSILAALYIEALFLRFITPAFNRQILLGLVVIGAIGALVTASLYRRLESSRLVSLLFAAQVLVSAASLVLAFILYRSLVPISAA